ncbi:MAG: helix-turn-helix transcriptional regulator [Desulfovibrionales bacterium]|nr:helix-turn-helix transcriptional regulator [Desulfovibrionales bacterium]
MVQTIHPIIKSYISVVKGLARAIGPNYELVLHDVSRPEHSIVAIENGELSGRSEITGRTLGSPITDFALQVCHQSEYENQDYICNYVNITKSGKKIRNNCIMIKDENKMLIGILCVNYDMTSAEILKGMADFLTASFNPTVENSPKELFPQRIDELINDGIEQAVNKLGRPLYLASKSEKIQIAVELEQKGFFRLDGSMDALAKTMGNTKFTLYSYLREHKKTN